MGVGVGMTTDTLGYTHADAYLALCIIQSDMLSMTFCIISAAILGSISVSNSQT